MIRQLLLAAAGLLASSAPTAAGQHSGATPRQTRTSLVGALPTPRQVKGGETVNLEVKLNRPAEAQGLEVEVISSDNRVVRVPRKVKVPAGVRTLGLTLKTGHTFEVTKVEILVKAGGRSHRSWLTVQPQVDGPAGIAK